MLPSYSMQVVIEYSRNDLSKLHNAICTPRTVELIGCFRKSRLYLNMSEFANIIICGQIPSMLKNYWSHVLLSAIAIKWKGAQ